MEAGEAPRISGVYVGWVEHHNLGDDLVEDIFLEMLAATLQDAALWKGSTTARVQYQPVLPVQPFCADGGGAACDFAVLGGGSILAPEYMPHIRVAVEVGAPLILWGTGTQRNCDGMSEEFKAVVCPPLGSARTRGRLFGGLRGRLTRACVQQACGLELPIVRDSGLLAAATFPAAALRVERPLVVVSFKEHATRARLETAFNPSSPEVLLKVQLTRQLAKSHAVVMVQPSNQSGLYDYIRGEVLGPNAAKQAPGGQPDLSAAGPAVQVYQAPENDYSTVMALYKAARWTYNERLHPGVFSASAGAPLMFFSNNMKFQDFASSIDGLNVSSLVMDSLHSMEHYKTTEELLEAINTRLRGLEAARQSLSESLIRVVPDTLLRYREQVLQFVHALLKAPKTASRLLSILSCRHIVIQRSDKADPIGFSRQVFITCQDS